MLDVLILFPKSAGLPELDDLVSNKMVPDLKQAQGLTSLRVSSGDLMARGGPPPYAKVIEASFESLPAFMAFVEARRQDQDQTAALDRFEPLIVYFDAAEA
jgi:hypothetical protein